VQRQRYGARPRQDDVRALRLPLLGWRDTLIPMIDAPYKRVNIELQIHQNEDGSWAAWCSLKWPDSALEQVQHYIDRRESDKCKGA
jgi:hypothetical protein